MTWADLAVSSGGTTCWESAFLRLPTVVGQIAQIEDLLVSGLKQLGLFYNAGWFARLSTEHLAEVIKRCIQDKEWRIRMSRLGHQTVDGLGGARILETINYN
jgi:spore coat polysaccharide biosynthesis predicted glycosyltransferase SpsG